MSLLQKFSQTQPTWTLEEFAQVINVLLPQYLPEEKLNARVREEITPRLIRHYTTLNMLDAPLKEGREARYTYRHLLQILIVRRLLIDGHSTGAIDQLATTSSNAELEAVLEGGVQFTISPSNMAMAYLKQIAPLDTSVQPTQISPRTDNESTPHQWSRVEIFPGLELHVRSDFAFPVSPQEQENLLHHLQQKLMALSPRRRTSS
jgi:DNA-binding transcriptional MerR regulator